MAVFDAKETASLFVDRLLGSLIKPVATAVAEIPHDFRDRVADAYKSYLSSLGSEHAQTKTFLWRDAPRNLYDFFVPLYLETPTKERVEASVEGLLLTNEPILIVGTGGSGKSLLVKHLILDCIARGNRLPVFIQLRHLRDELASSGPDSPFDLKLAIEREFVRHGLKLFDGYAAVALEAGLLFLLIDGYDELHSDHKAKVRSAIIRIMGSRYLGTKIIVTSRPDPEFDGWPFFHQYDLLPLGLESAVELVKKAPGDNATKDAFAAQLRRELYERHLSFASNPLLLSLMLLTYGEFAEIAPRMSVFYRQAYETLFQRYDALKIGFRRDRKSGLDLDQFGHVFSVYSLLTYDNRRFVMSETEARETFVAAKAIAAINFDPDAVYEDALQAVSLLIKDGMEVSFAHRSLQEFFVALFVVEAATEYQKVLLKRFSVHVSDQVIPLVEEMRPGYVGRHLILDFLEELFQGQEPMTFWGFLSRLGIEVGVGPRVSPGEGVPGGRTITVSHGAFCDRLIVILHFAISLGYCDSVAMSVDPRRVVVIDQLRVEESGLEARSTLEKGPRWKPSDEALGFFSDEGLVSTGGLAALQELRSSLAARYAKGDASLRELLRKTVQ